MLKNNVAVLVVISLFISSIAWADEPQIAIIKREGIPTPFAGVLYSNEAYARMNAQQLVLKERNAEELKFALGMQATKLKLTTATTANALESLKRSTSDQITLRDERISKLEDQLLKADEQSHTSDWQKLLWMSVGVGSVLLGALAIHLAATGALVGN